MATCPSQIFPISNFYHPPLAVYTLSYINFWNAVTCKPRWTTHDKIMLFFKYMSFSWRQNEKYHSLPIQQLPRSSQINVVSFFLFEIHGWHNYHTSSSSPSKPLSGFMGIWQIHQPTLKTYLASHNRNTQNGNSICMRTSSNIPDMHQSNWCTRKSKACKNVTLQH